MRGFDFKEYKIEQTASILYPFMGKKVFRSSLGSKGAGRRRFGDFHKTRILIFLLHYYYIICQKEGKYYSLFKSYFLCHSNCFSFLHFLQYWVLALIHFSNTSFPHSVHLINLPPFIYCS